MSEKRTQLELLKAAVRGLETISLSVDPDSAPDNAESAVHALAGTGYGTLNVKERSLTRFSKETLPDVAALTRSLRDNRAEYVRGAGFRVMCEIVAKAVIGEFRGRCADEVADGALAELKRKVDEWFTGAAVVRKHLVPCNVLPERGPSVRVRSNSLLPCFRSQSGRLWAACGRRRRRGVVGTADALDDRPRGRVAR